MQKMRRDRRALTHRVLRQGLPNPRRGCWASDQHQHPCCTSLLAVAASSLHHSAARGRDSALDSACSVSWLPGYKSRRWEPLWEWALASWVLWLLGHFDVARCAGGCPSDPAIFLLSYVESRRSWQNINSILNTAFPTTSVNLVIALTSTKCVYVYVCIDICLLFYEFVLE